MANRKAIESSVLDSQRRAKVTTVQEHKIDIEPSQAIAPSAWEFQSSLLLDRYPLETAIKPPAIDATAAIKPEKVKDWNQAWEVFQIFL
jgi:hypothetical protein